jgi:hypothetical protein
MEQMIAAQFVIGGPDRHLLRGQVDRDVNKVGEPRRPRQMALMSY